MYPYLRFAWVGLRALASRRLDPLAETALPMRVWPQDADMYFHLNNGRYLTLMDLGRLDWGTRNGLLQAAWRAGWLPLAGGATIRFRRAIHFMQGFELRTRIAGYDEKWFYLEQRFLVGGSPAATALVRILFKNAGGNATPAEILRLAGVDAPPPALPEAVKLWIAADGALAATPKKEEP